MADNNTGVLVALVGVGIAAVIMITGGSSSSSTRTATGGTSRQDVLEGFRDALEEQTIPAPTTTPTPEPTLTPEPTTTPTQETTITPTPTDDPDSMSIDTLETIYDGKFAEAVVSRTGYLPSGFDAAGRVNQINNGDTVGL